MMRSDKKSQTTVRPLRILQYTYGGAQLSGIDSYLYEADRSMSDPSVVFDYLYRYASPLREREDQMRSKGSRIYELKISEASNPLTRQIQEAVRLVKFFAAHRYEVLEINMTSTFMCLQAALIARLFGVRIRIVHAHDSAVSENRMKRALKTIFTPALRWSITDYWACSSDAAAYLFGDSFAQGEEWELVKNGVDVERFHFDPVKRKDLREDLSLGGRLTIGVVGRFVEQKNQKFAIDVFSELYDDSQDVELVFVGDGVLLNEVREYAAASVGSANIKFLGSREDIPALLSAFDVLLAPSLHEGFPVVAVEAQASGLPIVASTAFPPESDIIGTMRRLQLDDAPSEWAFALKTLLAVDRDRAAASVMAAGYDRSTTAARLTELYQSLRLPPRKVAE